MKEKIKLALGEELCDVGPAIVTAFIVVSGLAFLIIKTCLQIFKF